MPDKYIPYVVVFDMDETLGHFEQINIFWQVLSEYYKKENIKLDKKHLFEVIDIFNKILRPKILNILEYLKNKKREKICDKIIIFTNNTSKKWSNLIADYFNYKLEEPIIDQVIGAYKVKGKIIESQRTQYDKSFKDFINCSKLFNNPQICFLDDVRHPDMEHENVVYLRIKPYVYSYLVETMVNDYYNKNKNIINNKNYFINYMIININLYEYALTTKSELEQRIDTLLSKRLLEHLDEFFAGKKQKRFTI